MPSVAEKRANRDKVLAQLYEEVDGEPTLRDVHYEVLGPKVGLEDPELSSAVYWLVDNGYAEWTAMGGMLGITRFGADYFEELQEDDDPPVVVVVEVATEEQRRMVESLIHRLQDIEEALDLSADDAATLNADRESLEAQLRSPRPNKGVFRSAVQGIASVLGNVGTSAVGSAVFEVLKNLA